MEAQVFQSYLSELTSGGIDLATDTLGVLLVTPDYVPDFVNETHLGNMNYEIASGGGYTSPGKTLTNKSIITDTATGTRTLYGDDLTWTSSTISSGGCILFLDSGVESTSYLIAYFDFGSTKSTSNETLTIRWGDGGILSFVTVLPTT